jgi:hypothetical protein
MAKRFFTADWHLNSEGTRSVCNRPFKTVEKMNERIIANANSRAKTRSDLIVHVGDFCQRGDDNHYKTASVRHILVKAEAGEDGTYSDEAKAKAKARAEEILAEYQAGDKTEESFAALAEQYSEDEGSNTNGGLYENIYKGQMVQEFNDFCFGGHKSGDTAIVYGESGSYAGYHVVYYVGDGELYSDYIAKTDLQSEAMSDWTNELNEACTVTEGFGFRFVGK